MKSIFLLLVFLFTIPVPAQTNSTRVDTVIIAAGDSVSTALSLGDYKPIAIINDTVWTNAQLTFLAAHNSKADSNYKPVFNADSTQLIAKTAAKYYTILDPDKFAGLQYIKLKSGLHNAAVIQPYKKVLKVISKKY